MNVRITLLALILSCAKILCCEVICRENLTEIIGSPEQLGSLNSAPVNLDLEGGRQAVNVQTSMEVITILNEDFKRNVKYFVTIRNVFRKMAGYTEAIGNSLVYIGSGFSTIASACAIIGFDKSTNTLLFVGTSCFVTHAALIGIARCSMREEQKREQVLNKLAEKVGFDVTSLAHPIGDELDRVASARPIGSQLEQVSAFASRKVLRL